MFVVIRKTDGLIACGPATPRQVANFMWGRDTAEYDVYRHVGPIPAEVTSLERHLARLLSPAAEDQVRVLRVLEYTGPRSKVESTLGKSIHAEVTYDGMTIRESRLGSFPEVVERANRAIHATGTGSTDVPKPDATAAGGP